MQERRILLVEDDANDAELPLRALGRLNLGDKVDVTRDGQEALEYLECRGSFSARSSGDPAVVLMDVKMPRLSGLEALERIRANPALKTIPIVMLTSSRADGDLRKSYELGTNAYVVKPVAFEQYLQAVTGLGQFWVGLNEPPPTAR
jgi:CheY-like chemotaxis protein